MEHKTGSATPEKEEKLSKEELKLMKSLESGKLIEEKIVEEAMHITDKERLKWYVENLYDIDPEHGLIWKDYASISKQRKVVFQMIKQMGANLLKGTSIMNISLPISIMEPHTLLQRTACMFAYLPAFVEKLATPDPLERFKHYLAFCISSLHFNLNQRKPLNPVLGETYQGSFGDTDRFPVYCEQISHHPPITSLILESPIATIYLTRSVEAKTSPNSAHIKNMDKHIIIFKDSKKTTYKVKQCPEILVGGTIMGKRTLSYQRELTIKDCTNKLYAQIRFDPEKQGFFEKLFKKTEGHRSDFFKGFITKNKTLLKDLSRKAFYSKEIIAYCEGNWLENIKIDGDFYWEIGKEQPAPLKDTPGCLESDSTKRPDSIALLAGNEEEAQKCKELLENIQRKDRKLREEAMKKKK